MVLVVVLVVVAAVVMVVFVLWLICCRGGGVVSVVSFNHRNFINPVQPYRVTLFFFQILFKQTVGLIKVEGRGDSMTRTTDF